MGVHPEVPVASWLILLSHCLASGLLLFLHRALFWNINVLFDSPFLITLIESLFTTIICGCRLLNKGINIHEYLKKGPIEFSNELELRSYVPVSFTFMLLFNNLCLYYLDLPLYFVARSLSTIFSLIFSFKKLKLSILIGLFMSVLIVLIGYVITLLEEQRINILILKGVACGLLSSLCYTLYTSELSALEHPQPITYLKLIFFNNLCSSCILLAIAVFCTGPEELFYLPYYISWDSFLFYICLLSACLCAVYTPTVVAIEINLVSTPSRELFGLVRCIPQTVLAVLVFKIVKTPMWWLGNLLTLVGCGIYWRIYRSRTSPPLQPQANKNEFTII